jgi:hypothetical protein
MQRWEYRVVSLRNGRYTATLNEYGQEGWELVSVVTDHPLVPAPERRGGIPMPHAFGQLEDAAAKLNKLGTADATEAATSALLWVLRRPLNEDEPTP